MLFVDEENSYEADDYGGADDFDDAEDYEELPLEDIERDIWHEMHMQSDFFAQMWTEIQANLETISSSADRTLQWKQILLIVRRIFSNTEVGICFLSWPATCSFEFDDASGPGDILTPEEVLSYRMFGPLLDCAYLMFKCAEMVPSHGRGHLDAGLFNAIVGDKGGIWSSLNERFEIRDGFPWDRVFGDAVRMCEDAHIPALRLLSAMLLCQPLHIIKRTLSYHRNEDPISLGDVDWREDNKCLMLRNKLRLDFGPVGIHAKLKDITDADLLSRWRNARWVFDFLLIRGRAKMLRDLQADHHLRRAIGVKGDLVGREQASVSVMDNLAPGLAVYHEMKLFRMAMDVFEGRAIIVGIRCVPRQNVSFRVLDLIGLASTLSNTRDQWNSQGHCTVLSRLVFKLAIGKTATEHIVWTPGPASASAIMRQSSVANGWLGSGNHGDWRITCRILGHAGLVCRPAACGQRDGRRHSHRLRAVVSS